MDNNEKLIESAFQQFTTITTNTAKLTKQVKAKIRKQPSQSTEGFRWLASMAAVMLLIGGIYTASVFGIFDRLLQQSDDSFTAASDGFQIAVTNVEWVHGNSPIISISITDTVGSRLTNHVFIGVTTYGASGHSHLVSFDEETNTAHFTTRLSFSMEQPEYLDGLNITLFLSGSEWSTFPHRPHHFRPQRHHKLL